jgi:ribosome-associated protein
MKFPNKVVDICKLLDANKAQDIVVCDVTKLQNSIDYFIIATATSSAHIRGIVENISLFTLVNHSELGEMTREGFGMNSTWVVLAFGEVFVHLFIREERNRYNLEKLWNNGRNVTTFKRLISQINSEEKKLKLTLKKAEQQKQKEQRRASRHQKMKNDAKNKEQKPEKVEETKENSQAEQAVLQPENITGKDEKTKVLPDENFSSPNQNEVIMDNSNAELAKDNTSINKDNYATKREDDKQ